MRKSYKVDSKNIDMNADGNQDQLQQGPHI